MVRLSTESISATAHVSQICSFFGETVQRTFKNYFVMQQKDFLLRDLQPLFSSLELWLFKRQQKLTKLKLPFFNCSGCRQLEL